MLADQGAKATPPSCARGDPYHSEIEPMEERHS
jgi:hypothetical protein